MPAPDWSLLLRTPAFEITACLLGLVVGSFANVCIHRLPRGESIVSPPSRCPGCGARIEARDNLPVLAWLLLGGRCRDLPRPDLVALSRGRGHERAAVARARARPRTAAAHVRRDGARDGAPGPEPDRSRPPDPARRHHAAGCRARPRRELPEGLAGLAAARLRRGGGRLAGLRRRREGLREDARRRGARPGRLEARGAARRLPRLAEDAAHGAARVDGGHGRRPADDRAARPRHALRAAARDLPGRFGHARGVRGRPGPRWYRGLFGG